MINLIIYFKRKFKEKIKRWEERKLQWTKSLIPKTEDYPLRKEG